MEKEAFSAAPAFLQYGALGLLGFVLVLMFVWCYAVGLRLVGAIERHASQFTAAMSDHSKALASIDERVQIIMIRLMSPSGQMAAVRPPGLDASASGGYPAQGYPPPGYPPPQPSAPPPAPSGPGVPPK